MEKSFLELCRDTGTDKVNPHGYHFFYPFFLERMRNETFNMLEIGYGSGQSLKMWCEYFPKCNLFCMDIYTELNVSDRCRVIKANQNSKSDLQLVAEQVGSARLIIDDGSHNPKHQFETFTYLFEHLLEAGGTYIIEDIETSYWRPDRALYGYLIGNFDLMKRIASCQDMINHEFSKVENTLHISTITYGQNCIIITKRTKEEQAYFDRKYALEFMTRDSSFLA
ncbi:hypothetical protein [Haliscomenobacter hydrossis]|nr:hypothetical protein [Haliscomenobacter hydrossis]